MKGPRHGEEVMTMHRTYRTEMNTSPSQLLRMLLSGAEGGGWHW